MMVREMCIEKLGEWIDVAWVLLSLVSVMNGQRRLYRTSITKAMSILRVKSPRITTHAIIEG